MKNIAARNFNFIEVTYGHALTSAMRVNRELHDHFRNNPVKLEQHTDPISTEMIYRMEGYFLEFGDPKTLTYRRPLTWWDHLKQDHFPKWWLDRWPARELEQEVVIKDMFPFPTERFPLQLGPIIRIAEPLPAEFYPNKHWDPDLD